MNEDMKLDRAFWFKLIGLVVLARLVTVFLLLGDMPLINDAVHYSDFAAYLAEQYPGDKAYYWPPGTSMFVAFFYSLAGSELLVTRLVILLISVLSAVFVVLIAHQLLESRFAVRASGYIYALYPPALLLSGQLYSHHLAGLCLLVFAFTGIKAIKQGHYYYYVVAGLALGLGVLTRPSMMSVLPAFLVTIVAAALFNRESFRSMNKGNIVTGFFIVLIVSLSLVYPVAKHNHSYGAGWVVSTNNERNFFLGNNKFTPHYKTWHFASRPDLDDLDPEVREYFSGLYKDDNTRDAFRQAAKEYIIDNPGTTLLRTVNRLRAFWGFDYNMAREIQNYYQLDNATLSIMVAIEGGGYCLLMMLVIAGFYYCWRQCNYLLLSWLVLLVLGYQVPYALAFANGFYHYPVVLLLIPFAAIALQRYRGIAHDRTLILNDFFKNKLFLFLIAIFVFVQLEYAYFLILFSG